MPDATEHWTPEQYEHYKLTGEEPEQDHKPRSEHLREQILFKPNKADIAAEKDLQRNAENWLSQRGYYRCNVADAERLAKDMPEDFKGLFFHLHKTKQNPLLPDLVIFSKHGYYLMVEFKVHPVFQAGQAEYIEIGMWRLAWNFEEFTEMVIDWEEV